MAEQILIIDFGSQYTQLIARRVRELNVYCEIHPFNKIPEINENLKGVILSGSPYSVLENDAPDIDLTLFENIPLLGVCYGAQLMVRKHNGTVLPSTIREYGRARLNKIDQHHQLMKEIPLNTQVWMSHGDTISEIPEDFEVIASTNSANVAAFHVRSKQQYGIQFHPEVTHTEEGKTILRNFVVHICECAQEWTPDIFVESTITSLKIKLQDDKVVLGISGGVDSTVTAVLIDRAIGKNLTCIFVDNGLLRKNEFSDVLSSYQGMGLNVIGVDARQQVWDALRGLTHPEEKRKAIGKTFIEVFDTEAHKIRDVKWLAQGTIYPDVIESVSVKGPSATIKSHHNVAGLPETMQLKLIEPLRELFKDEVRKLGIELGLAKQIINRHPFPGPGLGVRILGEIKKDYADLLRHADDIFITALREYHLYDKVSQAFTVFLPVKSVGVKGDARHYEYVVALRAVETIDFMTARLAHLPYDFLEYVSNKIINEVAGISRVTYDISSKPPATIEWE